MKKIIITLCTIAALFGIIYLSSDKEHTHSWKAATCCEPMTCEGCGETQGKPREHYYEAKDCMQTPVCILCQKPDLTTQPGHKWVTTDCAVGTSCQNCTATLPAKKHNWTPGNCTEHPVCLVCKMVSTDVTEHTWAEATCTSAKICKRCRTTEGQPLGHTWVTATKEHPKYCEVCRSIDEATLPKPPENGEVLFSSLNSRGSSITVKASFNSCYVKLKNSDKEDVFAFFVHADETVTVSIPAGHYYVYFASGSTWQGTEFLFGPYTSYSMDPTLQDFVTYAWTYDLHLHFDGNLQMETVSEDDF